MTDTIVVVDDDPITRETLRGTFEDEGYVVYQARNADELMALLAKRPVDIILLDVRLPGRDGLSVTRELRVTSEVGIILITSRADRLDRIVGLEMGADDHIAKPFETREVLARARNLLRRMKAGAPKPMDRARRFGPWTLYLDRRRLVDSTGADCRLTSAEFELLSLFVCNPGRIMTRDYLLDATSRRKTDSTDRTIDTLVRRLRLLIEEDPKAPRNIVTVHGSGYVFAGDVVEDCQ
jgi:two-component system torCAD operon response regulator TorR